MNLKVLRLEFSFNLYRESTTTYCTLVTRLLIRFRSRNLLPLICSSEGVMVLRRCLPEDAVHQIFPMCYLLPGLRSPSGPISEDDKYEKVSLCLSYVHVRLLHLLAHHLLQLRRRRRAAREYAESVTVFQGQLQQLIHLHGTSVHNAFIDALQVFQGQVQQLIHLHVIDALPVFLSHSTCPLCRRSLLAPSELSPTCSPAGLVFESESSHDMAESARHGAAGGEPSAMAVRVLVPEGAKEVAVRVPAFSRARHGGMSEREASYHFFFFEIRPATISIVHCKDDAGGTEKKNPSEDDARQG